jgi:thiamine monophosphate synthase
MVRLARAPVYALGGVNARTVRRLRGTGIAGVAAVDGLA